MKENRIKRFNENSKLNEKISNELIEIINEDTFDDLYEDSIGYDFDKIESILKQQTKKLLFHFYDDFYFQEFDGGVQSFFRDIDTHIDLFAIDDDYFICKFLNNGYCLCLKIDSIDGINILADFIIENENELN